jgi:hypothetical protein
MTLKVRAASIAPDTRFGAAGALADPASAVVMGDVTIRSEECLPRSAVVPRYLRYAHREAVLMVDGVGSINEFGVRLSERIHCVAESGAWDDLGEAVIALEAVDSCFREVGLWSGNVYLAGAKTLRIVLVLAEQDAGLLPRGSEAVLRELAALELAYLFPVAGKFRMGTYDGEIQYRLNGWGRGLAARLRAGEAGAARADLYRRAIVQHLSREHQRYRSFLCGLEVGRQDYDGNKLDYALALPIPVLV